MCTIQFAVHPFIIKDLFIHCITVLSPETFTLSAEFVAICTEFDVTWEFNGSKISNDSNHVIIISELSKSRYKTSIRIIQSSESDAGTYTVTVTSTAGSDSMEITVKISKLAFIYCYLSIISCIPYSYIIIPKRVLGSCMIIKAPGVQQLKHI